MNDKKITAMDVANYIVDYVDSNSLGNLTPLKLQKILYYVSTAYLKKSKKPLFTESFEKWQYGPVVTSVYHNFKSFGINHIDHPISVIEVDMDSVLGFKKVSFDKKIFDDDDLFQQTANTIITKLIKKSAFELVEITHQEEAWSKFEQLIAKGTKDLKYSIEELLEAKDF